MVLDIRIETVVCMMFCMCAGCDSPSEYLPATNATANNTAKSEEKTSSSQTHDPFAYYSADWINAFKADWDKDFKIQLGMTIEELESYIELNNKNVNAAKPPEWVTEEFHPPAYAYPELRLHVFIKTEPHLTDEDDPTKSLKYWVNGRTQFWMDLAIEQGRIKSIAITPGNFSAIFEPFLLAGEASPTEKLTRLKKAENESTKNLALDREEVLPHHEPTSIEQH